MAGTLRTVGVGLLLAVLSACSAQTRVIPDTPLPPVSEVQAFKFCQDVSEKSRAASAQYTVAGWATAIPAAGALAYAGMVGTDDTHKTFIRRNPGIGLTFVGAALGTVSLFLFSRASAATETSVAANTAMAGKSEEAFGACVAAKTGWIGSRSDSNAVASRLTPKDSQSQISKATNDAINEAVAKQLKEIISTTVQATKEEEKKSAAAQ